MKHLLQVVSLSVLVAISAVGMADPASVRTTLQGQLPELKIDAVQQSEIPGLYEVVSGAQLLYVTTDGRYLLQGKAVELQSRTDVTERRLSSIRLAAIDRIGPEQMILFTPSAPQKTRHTVSVFTDIDCGYCRKFHSQIGQYLDQGIAVRYLFLPRAGVDSESYRKAVSVWCADDRQQALTEAKKGVKIAEKTCENPVRQHMALADDLGARGTPLIVTDRGELLPGYVSPTDLARLLDGEVFGQR